MTVKDAMLSFAVGLPVLLACLLVTWLGIRDTTIPPPALTQYAEHR
jgi:hypothetical protein